MRWLWIVVISPLLALQAEEQQDPSEVGQTKLLQRVKDEPVNKTLQESETDRMWVNDSKAHPSNGSWGISTTPLHTTVKSSTESNTRRLPEPSIAIRSVNGTCNVTLHCAVTGGGGGGDVSYTWTNSKMSAVLSKDPTLRLTQKPPNGSLDYTCTVRSKESENSRTVSLSDHCHDPPSLSQGLPASFYAKYIIPLLIVLVLLLGLFFMYRRKRGGGSHSSTASIYESSDSDDEEDPAEIARLDSSREAFTAIPEEALEATEASPINEDQAVLGTQDRPPSQM
ncbi:SLAM family member 5-like isoform X2 [Elgaria multicarinata webbii]|uniref:SLAM family member 5-like isoform X2 n=1 Tax=Elgaria multicarinata webbii TaxID=159646 RepID=UPI002FCCF983